MYNPKNVIIVATAIVPTDMPGGPHYEKGYTHIPVRVTEVTIVDDNIKKYFSGRKEHIRNEATKNVRSIQEVLLEEKINVPRGTLLSLEFDLVTLGGVTNWAEQRAQGLVVRAEPYAVNIKFPKRNA